MTEGEEHPLGTGNLGEIYSSINTRRVNIDAIKAYYKEHVQQYEELQRLFHEV
jgi:predicted ATPase